MELAPDRLLTEQEFYDALKKGWLAGGVIKNGMVNLGVAPVMVRTMMVGRQWGVAQSSRLCQSQFESGCDVQAASRAPHEEAIPGVCTQKYWGNAG